MGNYFDLKHNLVCLAELKEPLVGNEPFFADVGTHVSELTAVITLCVYRNRVSGLIDSVPPPTTGLVCKGRTLLVPQPFIKTLGSVHSERGLVAVL